MSRISLASHLKRLAVGWAAAGLLLTLSLCLSVSVVLFVKDVEHRSRSLAESLVASFRTDLVSGDVRAAELQARKQLALEPGERLQFLDEAKRPWVAGDEQGTVEACDSSLGICRDWAGGKIQVLKPIYFDSEGKTLWGYLLLERNLKPNWTLISSVALAILFGMFFQNLGFYFNLSNAIASVSGTLTSWAERLSADPKGAKHYAVAPYSELRSIESALSGLNNEIATLEKAAHEHGALSTLRGVGHDILNPVSRMKRILWLLNSEQSKAENANAELLASLESNLKRLSGYAEQLKHIYKKHASNSASLDQTLDASAEIRALMGELAFDADALDRKISLHVRTDEGCFTGIPKAALARIIENVVVNSIQASPAGGVVQVLVKKLDSTIQVSISDDGHGIRNEDMNRIFESGFTTKPNKGTGLGLFVVKQLTEQYGGGVEVFSKEGEGTKFSLRLPLVSY